MLLNLQSLVIEHFVKELQDAYQQTYSLMEPQYGNILVWMGRLALENIANSDALYHDVEHTIMVSLVGQAVLKGKHLTEGGVTPKDWLHFMMALLCHDIGYVRGVCRADGNGRYATGQADETVVIPAGSTDAALTPYHVNRSKLFIYERFSGSLTDVDPDVIAHYIEMTRFPSPTDNPIYQETADFGGLARACDLIGQLGDPDYLRKVPALYYEFEEVGENKRIGYTSPGHMRENFAKFYWSTVSPYIQDALRYLRKTQEGKVWVASLHSHVFDMEHNQNVFR